MMATTAQAGVVFPPRDLTALLDLGRFLEHHSEPGLLLGPDGEQVPLPRRSTGYWSKWWRPCVRARSSPSSRAPSG